MNLKKKLRRIVSGVLTTAILLTATAVPALAANVKDFTDVKSSDWFYDSVAYAAENNMVSGTSTTTFSPNQVMTRGMFVTILGRFFSNGTETGNKFTDVSSSQYYYPYVYWAVEYGIVFGTSNTTFEPDTKVTRQQIAAMVGRVIKNLNLDIPKKNDSSFNYSDKGQIDSYATDGVQICWETGLMIGDTNGTFRPQAGVTRAEGTTVLARLAQAVAAKEAPPETPPEDVVPIPSPDPTPTPSETPDPSDPAHNHVFKEVEKKESTMNEAGYIKYRCDCGEEITTELSAWNTEWYPDDHDGVSLAEARKFARDYAEQLGFVVTNNNIETMNCYWDRRWRLNGTKCDPNYNDTTLTDVLFGVEFNYGAWITEELQKQVIKMVLDKFYNHVITTGVEITDDRGTYVTHNVSDVAVGYYIERCHVHCSMYCSARTLVQ